MKHKVTIIGTLPPIKGLSPYCRAITVALSKKTNVEFIGFKELYPNSLYPGGTKIDGKTVPQKIEGVEIRNFLTWYNPISWIKAGLTAEGDILHVQWWSYMVAYVYFIILLLAHIRGKRIILTVHNVMHHENNWLNTFLNRVIFHFGDHIIVHTEKNKRKLISVFSINSEKISIIPHGILRPYSMKNVSKKEARKKLNISLDKSVLLFFGNIRDYKGLDILLEALSLICEKKQSVLLLIAGEPWEDWRKYKKIIQKNELSKFISAHLNFIQDGDIVNFFQASDIIVLPYKNFDSQSGFGALSLSFMKPLIVTRVGGLPDYVKDERTIADPNDSKDLARKILNILQDEKLIKKLSKDSEELAKKYSWDEIAKLTTSIYKKEI